MPRIFVVDVLHQQVKARFELLLVVVPELEEGQTVVRLLPDQVERLQGRELPSSLGPPLKDLPVHIHHHD